MHPVDFSNSVRVRSAYEFAERAHREAGQVRMYTGEPYIVHPLEVARIVASVEHTPEMLMAALLHDVLEDTPVIAAEIEGEFGVEVAGLVGWLTKVSKKSDGTRSQRLEVDMAFLRLAPAPAQTIKIADIISNCSTLAQLDPGRAQAYLGEKLAVIYALEAGDPGLRDRALQTVQNGLQEAAEILRRREVPGRN